MKIPKVRSKSITYAEAINQAHSYCLRKDKNVFLMGLGVPDPKGIFGTTVGLEKKFGTERVFDIPLSENAITGAALGAAITGLKPILTHQRLDFALVSMEQIINQLAKWNYMFGDQTTTPVVIRMIIGRGWGQGPQHSQSLQSLFAHIPGLKVVMPTTAYDVKGMLISALDIKEPIIFLEHRWLYQIKDSVPTQAYKVKLDTAKKVINGSNITIVGISYMTIECIKAADYLKTKGINAEIIDLRSIRPLDLKTIIRSVKKTRKLLVVDNAHMEFGISAEIICSLSIKNNLVRFECPPQRLGFASNPTPTSKNLANDYYPTAKSIVKKVFSMLSQPLPNDFKAFDVRKNSDQPDKAFQGPF